jgi:cytidyltransferase-like protein
MTKVGVVRGTFQIIHPGHVKLLVQAKSLVDKLYVFIDSDTNVKKIKGECLVPAGDRAAVLMGLKPVDDVRIFQDEDHFKSLVDIHKGLWEFNDAHHKYYFKGGDYKPNDLPEYSFLTWCGWTVCCLGHSGHSTSDIVKRIKNG